jgi:hypothetical protein
METEQLQALAQVVLPTEILEYYEVSGVEQSETEIHIHLDERMQDSMKRDKRYESKGFMEEVSVTDFPIRDHKVVLLIRRRRWVEVSTGKSFTVPAGMDVTADGTRYSKEFGAFLKETYGDVPGDLPCA